MIAPIFFLQALQRGYANSNSSMVLHNLLSGALTNDFVGNEDDLQRISSDLLSVNALANPMRGQNDGDLCRDVAQGKKAVSVPPGLYRVVHITIGYTVCGFIVSL